jgi:hypothetical protein
MNEGKVPSFEDFLYSVSVDRSFLVGYSTMLSVDQATCMLGAECLG